MKALNFSRCALSISMAAALTACGGSSVPIRGADNSVGSNSSSSGSKTFNYTGKKQSFIVPTGITQLEVVVRGGAGGDSGVRGSPSFIPSGFGGRVDATIPAQPGEKLYVFVGGRNANGTGGFNGGGNGTSGGDGGGGASDIRAGGDALQDRIIVAAGGGGSGGQLLYTYGWGGNGGGYRGRPGGGGHYECGLNGQGGGGGTQHRGGAGGTGGTAPSSGTDGTRGANGAAGSGGDGGASYGGGGGGGGGSSYIMAGATHRRIWTGYKRARSDGLVIISWN